MKDNRVDFDIDLTAVGYPAVRRAFNDTLQLCVEKLTKSELRLAHDILGFDMLDEDEPGDGEMLADTALYSRKESAGPGAGKRRAIDRIAPKLIVKRDPLRSAIATRLPAARFSIFAIEGAYEQGGVIARDLLDEGSAALHIMDQALAAQAAAWGEFPIAGRFVDLGPWYIGFGIVVPLRKSEIVAIRLAVSGAEDKRAAQETLHELIYPSHLHGANLVMAALEPMITAFASAIDSDTIEFDDLIAGLPALLPGKPTPKRNRTRSIRQS